MPRAATTSDTFNAVANRAGETSWTISPLASAPSATSSWRLRLAQPSVSKHLQVLHDVGLVEQRGATAARCSIARNAEAIKPLHEWTSPFERYWRNQLIRVKERAERAIEAE